MSALEFIITDAGRQAIVDEDNAETLPVTISEIKFGDGDWTPDETASDLNNIVATISEVGSNSAAAPDTISLTVSDHSSSTYTVREIGLYTDAGILFAIYAQSTPILTKAAVTAMLATFDLVFDTVPAGSVTVGDISFDYSPASTTTKGVVELATQPEMDTGTDTARVPPVSVIASALAAKLNIGQSGLGADAVSVSNLNTISTSGFYRGNGSATGAPDVSADYRLIHIQDGDEASQIAITTPSSIYMRDKDDGASWAAWQKMYTQGSPPAAQDITDIKTGGHSTGDEANTYITVANIAGDTNIGLLDANLSCQRVGDTAVLSGSLKLNLFSVTLPTDSTFTFTYDLERRASAEGWFESISHTTHGAATLETSGVGFDKPLQGIRVIAEPGGLRFHSGEVDDPDPSAPANELRVHFSIVVRVS